MPNMTLRRLASFERAVASPFARHEDVAQLFAAAAQRRGERNRSKLARRIRQKHNLRRSGAI